jgi:hypothetical protein
MGVQPPTEVTNATIVYIVLTVAAMAFVRFLQYTGYFDKDNSAYVINLFIIYENITLIYN